MEFKFNVNDYFKEPIVEITQNLLPPGFRGDKRALWDTIAKMSEVVNTMGMASATAQGLTKPITTAERLRNSEHKLYLFIDRDAGNGAGAITGMLKTGKKGLYVFDRDGQHHQVQPNCILDFYVHESRQRQGLGRQLFSHMLEKEKVEPVKMAIDRPSEKFLAFLNKHYNLNNAVRQMNNFVVFDGFFPKSEEQQSPQVTNNNSVAAGDAYRSPKQSANGLQPSNFSHYGRYSAPRPICSMGQIIHNDSPVAKSTPEPSGDTQPPVKPTPKLERPRSLSIQLSEDVEKIADEKNLNGRISEGSIDQLDNVENDVETLCIEKINNAEVNVSLPRTRSTHNDLVNNEDKSEQLERKPSNLTEQGFVDLKFYHSRLW